MLLIKGLGDDPAAEAADEAAPVGAADAVKQENAEAPAGSGDDGAVTKAAYDTARKEWLDREPAAKGAQTGTEYLQAQAGWRRWYAEGDEEGLNGTADGYSRWAAKRASVPEETGAQAGVSGGSGGGDGDTAVAAAADEPVEKRDFDANVGGGTDRDKLPASDFAGKHRSFPIVTAGDVTDALQSIGRAGDDNYDSSTLRSNILSIARRKGFPVPASASASKAGKGKKQPCGTCDGSGKIKGGNVTCPDCKGKGTMKLGAAAAKAASDAVAGAVSAGLITEEAAKVLLDDIAKATRPLPADTEPAAPHREPDGTTTVEQLEPDAGLPTDPDPVPDKVPSSVEAAKEAPYAVARMHDACCAAYGADEVLDTYPALKSVGGAFDPAWFRAEASAAAGCGDDAATTALAGLASAAELVKAADPAAVADGHGWLHKAFTDMYPNEHLSPSAPSAPGRFQRPYLSAGHAAGHPAGSPDIPPSTRTPEPENFHRGALTEGRAAASPSDSRDNNPVPPGTPRAARQFYTTAARDQARIALQSMHDHISGVFPELCPMAASKTVLPPDLGATSTPKPVNVQSQGGIANVEKDSEAAPEATAPATPAAPAEPRIPKKVRKALERLATGDTAPGPALDTATIRALLAEQLAPLAERWDTQLAGLRKELDDLASEPDPALAPLRGAVARAPGAAPAQRRSLAGEAVAADQARKQAGQQAAAYRAYIENLTRSPDPGTREKAIAVLEKMGVAA